MVLVDYCPKYDKDKETTERNRLVALPQPNNLLLIGRIDEVTDKAIGLEKRLGTVYAFMHQSDPWWNAFKFYAQITTCEPVYELTEETLTCLKEDKRMQELGIWSRYQEQIELSKEHKRSHDIAINRYYK
jgi:hypothetical protein